MQPVKVKSVEMRLGELIEIRKSLAKLHIVDVEEKIKTKFNYYLKYGEPSMMRLYVDQTTCAIVTLSKNSQCGVVLEYLKK